MMTTQRTDEEGFSIVELFVVMLILSILAGIAIAVFLGQREKASSASAQQTLRNMLLIAESVREDQGADQYSVDLDDYRDESPSYTYVTGADAPLDPSQVSVHGAGGGDIVVFSTRAISSCYYLRLEGAGDQFRHKLLVDGAVECSATEFETGPGDGWE